MDLLLLDKGLASDVPAWWYWEPLEGGGRSHCYMYVVTNLCTFGSVSRSSTVPSPLGQRPFVLHRE